MLTVVLQVIRALFAQNSQLRARIQGRGGNPPSERLCALQRQLSPPLGEALTSLQRQWMRVSLFLLDGDIELTNNRSERELRPVVVGQHTWLFAGDEMNAARLAAGFSVVQTALAHGANPRAYLHAFVAKLIAGHSHTRLDELLPDAMLGTNPETADLLRPRPGTRVADLGAQAASSLPAAPARGTDRTCRSTITTTTPRGTARVADASNASSESSS